MNESVNYADTWKLANRDRALLHVDDSTDQYVKSVAWDNLLVHIKDCFQTKIKSHHTFLPVKYPASLENVISSKQNESPTAFHFNFNRKG